MRYLLAALLVLLAPTVWAQKADRPDEKDIAAYREHHLDILKEVRPFIPRSLRPEDLPGLTHAEYLQQGADKAREGLPRLKALIVQLQAIPGLKSTGSSEWDAALQTMHVESIRFAQIVQGMAETTIAMDEAMRVNDDAKVGEGADRISAYSLEMQQSTTAMIRAGKSEPGFPAEHASIEGLALFMDAMGIIPQYQLGLKDAATCSKEVSVIAKHIRDQATLIRQAYAAQPGKDLGATIHAARLAFPGVLEEAATQLEIASFRLSLGQFDPVTALATIHALNNVGLAPAFDAAWPGN